MHCSDAQKTLECQQHMVAPPIECRET